MNERSTSRRVWDYRQPYSAEDRLDQRGSRTGGRYAEYAEEEIRRGRGVGQPGMPRYGGGRDDPFAEPRHAEHGYGAGHFGEGRYGRSYEEPVGDNPYGTYPSTGEVMRGNRGLSRPSEQGEGRGRRGGDLTDERLSRGQPGGPWPDQSRTPWRDRYEPDDPRTRANLAQAYGISDSDRLDAPSWPGARGSGDAGRRQAGARWMDEGGRFPESERPGRGGRPSGWPGDDWSAGGQWRSHGRDEAYERFSGAPQRVNWGQGSGSGSGPGRRVSPKGYQRSDERIREDLCERLAHDDRLEVQDVEVQVSGGVVTLTGAVRDRRQKYCVEDIADDIFGVREVHNRIRVQREGGQVGQGSAGSAPEGQRVSGISTSGSATGSSASSYVGGMEVGAGEVPKGTDPYGGTTTPGKHAT